MTKRRPSKELRQARSLKPAAKTQQVRRSVVRSPNPPCLRSVRSDELPKLHSRPDTRVVGKTESVLLPQPTTSSPIQPATRDDDTRKMFSTFSGIPNVASYQRRLPEIGQAYLRLGFDFAHSFAQIKSPLEIPRLLSDLTMKQFAIFQDFVFAN